MNRRKKYIKVKNIKKNNMPKKYSKRLGRLTMKDVNKMIK